MKYEIGELNYNEYVESEVIEAFKNLHEKVVIVDQSTQDAIKRAQRFLKNENARYPKKEKSFQTEISSDVDILPNKEDLPTYLGKLIVFENSVTAHFYNKYDHNAYFEFEIYESEEEKEEKLTKENHNLAMNYYQSCVDSAFSMETTEALEKMQPLYEKAPRLLNCLIECANILSDYNDQPITSEYTAWKNAVDVINELNY